MRRAELPAEQIHMAESSSRNNKTAERILMAFALAAVMLIILTQCARPTRDQEILAAIRAEAEILMSDHQTESSVSIPEDRWPPAIARLEPEFVSIVSDGAYLMMKPYFDGGWGYFIPRDPGELPEPAGRFSALGQDVYWYRPD